MALTDISFDGLRNLAIGTVETVSTSEIRILLDINAPENTALNTGEPTLFPKINGYVLIPNEAGSLVCIISWIGIEGSTYPKRKGFKDFDLVDLPFPLRKMSVSPLGIIKTEIDNHYKIDRGVYSYPSVGDSVVLPTRKQLEAIVENRDEKACVKIGVSPLAANAPVYVAPDKLYGRHVAVLGNTGSGKSCSVAGLIRWSLEAAQNRITESKKNGEPDRKISIDKPNARFIILDPNGEYSRVFDDFSVRKFCVSLGEEDDSFQQLRVPVWMWNSYEWNSITQASGKTQRPLLIQTLRAMRNELALLSETNELEIRRFLETILLCLKAEKNSGSPWGKFPKPKNFTEKLKKWRESVDSYLTLIDKEQQRNSLSDLNDILYRLLADRSCEYPIYEFSAPEVNDIQARIEEAVAVFGGSAANSMTKSEDTPISFNPDDFIKYFKELADDHDASKFVDYLLMRIKTILADTRMASVVGTDDDISLLQWLEEYIGKHDSQDGPLTIIDLSIVPSDIIHIVVSVIARIVFEALQRYRRKNRSVLPTVLVMEEAHSFISKYNYESEDLPPARLCTETFERIAKEGRKFGLGLVLSSQRPSELSPTVLSQCNTFLLHRIVNDRDQELVKKLVPDNLGKILNELPTLPTRKAILLGWAAPVPILVEIDELVEAHRPEAKDPDFWAVWTGQKERSANWKEIVREWQDKDSRENE